MSLSEQVIVHGAADALLYAEVQHFYARQMRLLDEGAVHEWAQTFTDDGVFAANAHPRPCEGRAAIEAAARQSAQELARDRVQRRHWLGMLQVDDRPDGSILARSYALIVSTPQGGQAAVHLSCACDDVLVREYGTLRVQRRQVYRDDLPRE
jgi:3-phenylpropionate/cinnamic acid dioxygenase small subunit